MFQEILTWKIYMDRRTRERGVWGYHNCRANFFCLTVPKKFLRWTLVFQKCSGIEKFLDERGITILSSFLSLRVPKNFVGAPQCFRKIGVLKNLRHNRGVSRFLLKDFSLKRPKNFAREPVFVSENFCYAKKIMDKSGKG